MILIQVAPAELESIIITHPCVLDTAVYGIPDEVAGELIRAAVVKKPGCSLLDTDVVQFVKGTKSFSSYVNSGVVYTLHKQYMLVWLSWLEYTVLSWLLINNFVQ